MINSANARLAGLIVLACTSACASAPEKINPIAIADNEYAALSCQQLGAESQRVQTALDGASSAQRTARRMDAVGVALVGLPAASLLGANHTHKIARLKGQQLALWRQSTQYRCVMNAEGEFASASDAKAPPIVTR